MDEKSGIGLDDEWSFVMEKVDLVVFWWMEMLFFCCGIVEWGWGWRGCIFFEVGFFFGVVMCVNSVDSEW